MNKPKRIALYVRVSTDGQTTENQRLELEAVAERHDWKIVQVYTDHGISGAKGRDKRPGFDALCKAITQKKIDLVAVWSVDRLSRSLQDLIGFLAELHSKHVDLYLHQQGLDTSTPAGKAMFQMLGVFAEFERAMIRERVNAGLARARDKGTRSGLAIGRPATARAKVEQIVKMKRQGLSAGAIARALGIGKASVIRLWG